MLDKPSVAMQEQVAPIKPPLQARLAAHWKKRWWVHLLITTVCTLTITLPLVFVGYPRIAQSGINSSTLDITSMVISDPSPQGFHIHQTQIVGTSSIFHPTLFSFNAAVRFAGQGADTPPMLNITVPELKANDGETVEVDQQVTLQNTHTFAAFNKAMMLNKEVSMEIYGRPDLKQAGLRTITVTYNKTITMKGFDKLNGFKILEMHLDPDRDDGMNSNGTVLIPNPSVVTISMGNVTFDISSRGTKLGQTFLHNLVLRPGENKIPMLAKINQLALLRLLPRKAPYIVPVEVAGNSSVYNGKTLSYFTEALVSNTIKFDLDVSEALPT